MHRNYKKVILSSKESKGIESREENEFFFI
jgi:hypothetical protein